MEESRISQLSYIRGEKQKALAMLRGRLRALENRRVVFSNPSSDQMTEGDNYVNTSPSTGKGELCVIRNVLANFRV